MADQLETLKLLGNPLALRAGMDTVSTSLQFITPDQLAAAQAQLEQAGTDSAQGLADGMTAGAPTVATAGGDMSQAAIDAAQDTLQRTRRRWLCARWACTPDRALRWA